uniref:uncharacterized protein LOC128928288 n=1 Tax=Callithrix jacchus TaxID=9483 RepID=UPI0023DD5506|nr:uncharacterized protein LOC128928288 [Callithrix jacchus]
MTSQSTDALDYVEGAAAERAPKNPKHAPYSTKGKRLNQVSVPTTGVCKELDLFQGVKLLFRAVGYAEGCAVKPHTFDFQVAGIHKEHVSRRQMKQKNVLEHCLLLGLIRRGKGGRVPEGQVRAGGGPDPFPGLFPRGPRLRALTRYSAPEQGIARSPAGAVTGSRRRPAYEETQRPRAGAGAGAGEGRAERSAASRSPLHLARRPRAPMSTGSASPLHGVLPWWEEEAQTLPCHLASTASRPRLPRCAPRRLKMSRRRRDLGQVVGLCRRLEVESLSRSLLRAERQCSGVFYIANRVKMESCLWNSLAKVGETVR